MRLLQRPACGQRSVHSGATAARRVVVPRAAAAAPSDPPAAASNDLHERARRRTRAEVVEAGARIGLKATTVEERLDVFHSLLPSLPINLEQMRASDWAKVVADPELAAKVVMIKVAFPALNVEMLLRRQPRMLLWPAAKMQDNLDQVGRVLGALPRPEAVLLVLPELLDPRQCYSVIATLRKWFPKKDPLDVLQADPEVILRGEKCDVPLEPVFFDAKTGIWTAAGYSRSKQEEWQVYIEQVIHKRKPQPIDSSTSVVVRGGGTAAASGDGVAAAGAVAEFGGASAGVNRIGTPGAQLGAGT